jgi:flagellar hook-length control protein FliK
MTNQTNLDYLFKLTAPVSERGAGGPTSPNGRRPVFDDHLVNASASGTSSPISDRKNPNESALLDGNRPNGTRPAENSTSAAISSDAQDDATDQAARSLEGKSTDDADASEDENAAEQSASDQLAGAATVAEHSAQISKKDSVVADDQLAESATTGKPDREAEQPADNLPARDVRDKGLAAGDAALNVEIDANGPAQSSDSSANGGPKQANASNSAHAAFNDDKRPRGASGVSAAADDAALAKKAAVSAEQKPAKSTASGRRGTSQNKESTGNGRTSSSSETNRADANASPSASVAAAIGNVANAQTTTAAATGEASEGANRAIKPVGHNAEGNHLTARAQRSGIAGRRAQAAQVSGLPRVDTARFVGRVAKAVQTAQDRGGLVQLRLSPPELGSLRLELTMQNGVMTAAVETETPAARQVLLDHLPALRERLAEQNIRIERFDVDVRQENSGGQADPRAQQEQRQNQPQQPKFRQATGRTTTIQTTTGDAPRVLTQLTNSELNLLA